MKIITPDQQNSPPVLQSVHFDDIPDGGVFISTIERITFEETPREILDCYHILIKTSEGNIVILEDGREASFDDPFDFDKSKCYPIDLKCTIMGFHHD